MNLAVTSLASPAMLAHQGGWDEFLIVGLPLALIGVLLFVANRRVSAQLARAAAESDSGHPVSPAPHAADPDA